MKYSYIIVVTLALTPVLYAMKEKSEKERQLDQVVAIMTQNIAETMERGEPLDTFQDHTDELMEQTAQFRQGTSKLKGDMGAKNRKLNCLICAIASCCPCISCCCCR